MRILQIGCGAFGTTHLGAWAALGRIADVTVADPSPEARRRAEIKGAVAIADWREGLAGADVLTVLAPTDRHYAILREVVGTGLPIFVEKPMTTTALEAADIAALARGSRTRIHVGMYFRSHPKARWLKDQIEAGALGRLRYLRGDFFGFKRARADSGALENDAVHFLDLFSWLIGERPAKVSALTRDHFGRGREDFAVLLLDYPSGAAARVEVGHIQPGQSPDTIVPDALTTKCIAICGENGTIEIDFQAETIRRFDLRFEANGGMWVPDFKTVDASGIEAAGPVTVVATELAAFVAAIEKGGKPIANAEDGWALAATVDAAKIAAREGRAVAIG